VNNIDYPSNQTTILIGQEGIGYHNPHFFPLLVGNTILGGMPLTSLLFREIREKNGFAYSTSSVLKPLAFNGPFIIALQTVAKNKKAALQAVMALLKSYVADGPSDAELNAAKQFLTGNFVVELSSNAAIASALTRMAVYDLPLSYLDTYTQHIQSVTQSQVKQSFQDLIHLNALHVITVGPKTAHE
jgi:zinc protease